MAKLQSSKTIKQKKNEMKKLVALLSLLTFTVATQAASQAFTIIIGAYEYGLKNPDMSDADKNHLRTALLRSAQIDGNDDEDYEEILRAASKAEDAIMFNVITSLQVGAKVDAPGLTVKSDRVGQIPEHATRVTTAPVQRREVSWPEQLKKTKRARIDKSFTLKRDPNTGVVIEETHNDILDTKRNPNAATWRNAWGLFRPLSSTTVVTTGDPRFGGGFYSGPPRRVVRQPFVGGFGQSFGGQGFSGIGSRSGPTIVTNPNSGRVFRNNTQRSFRNTGN